MTEPTGDAETHDEAPPPPEPREPVATDEQERLRQLNEQIRRERELAGKQREQDQRRRR